MYLKRFYLIADKRFFPIINYHQYKGWKVGKKPRKWLWLSVWTLDKKGQLVIKKRLQLVRVKKGYII